MAGHAASALLPGDLEKAQEASLVQAADAGTIPPLRADVLLVPHHGSKTSSSAAFLAAVQPHWAIAQAGYRNRFQHPAPLVAQRYADRGIPLQSTVGCGAALWQSAEPLALGCQRQRAPRYWQHTMGAMPAAPGGAPVPDDGIGEINPLPNPDEG